VRVYWRVPALRSCASVLSAIDWRRTNTVPYGVDRRNRVDIASRKYSARSSRLRRRTNDGFIWPRPTRRPSRQHDECRTTSALKSCDGHDLSHVLFISRRRASPSHLARLIGRHINTAGSPYQWTTIAGLCYESMTHPRSFRRIQMTVIVSAMTADIVVL